MAIDKGKIDAGQGGKRGHSNMAHWIYSHELKEASRKARRLDAKRAVRSGLADLNETPPRPARAATARSRPAADDFPSGLGGPALRALHRAGIRALADVARWSDKDLSALHGIGPKALAMLRRAAKSPQTARTTADAKGRIRAYLAALPPDSRLVLLRIRRAIHSAVPRGEDGFSYGIPCVRRDGKVVVWYAAWTKHVALYPVGATGTGKFPLSDPPSAALVRRLVKTRLAGLAK